MQRNEISYKKFFYLLLSISVILTYLLIVIINNYNKKYAYGFTIPAALLIFAGILFKKYKEEKGIREVRESYGHHISKKKVRKINTTLYEIKKENCDYYIDDQTFKDLNLLSVFNKINNTFTTMGEECLYNILRIPLFNKDKIYKRNENIKFFQDNAKVRDAISIGLHRLSKFKKGDMPSFLYKETHKKSYIGYLVNLMFLITVLGIVYVAINPNQILYIFVLFVINYGIHGLIKNKAFDNIDVIRDVGAMVYAAKKISSVDCKGLSLMEELIIANNSCKKLGKITSSIGSIEGVDVIGDYFRILFLVEERNYFGSIAKISSNLENLRKVYDILGEIDAYISIASYRKYVGEYTLPIFSDKTKYLNMEGAYHPLINNPVKNEILLEDKGVILTGSNMSGKSTFLKTLGINILFSQTIVTVLSSYYEGSMFRVITSISPEDNILEGKSYYLAEAEALLRITKLLNNKPLFCLIDEIFRGTNPLERTSSSAEILDYIAKNGGVPVVATHDIELTKLTYYPFDLYYFKEDVGDSGLTFDYKIRKGVSNTQNAIKLLEFLGYPKEITEKANKRVLMGKKV